MLSEFAKVERKVWRVQVPHLHNAAIALSSSSRCFQLSTNLGKDFFCYPWCIVFLSNLNAEIVACILVFRKSRNKPNLESTSIWFFPQFGGKKGGVLSMHMQVIADSHFARPGSASIEGGKNGKFRDWTISSLAWGKFLWLCTCTQSLARANDAKIVRNRDAQCNTEESP